MPAKRKSNQNHVVRPKKVKPETTDPTKDPKDGSASAKTTSSSSAAAASSASVPERPLPLPAVRPSSHEKRPPIAAIVADGWPKVERGWPSVLKTDQFYSLLEDGRISSWTRAIQLAKENPGDIDCNWIPDAADESFLLWLNGGRENNVDSAAGVVIQMYHILCEVGVPKGSTVRREIIDSADATSSQLVRTLDEALQTNLERSDPHNSGHGYAILDAMEKEGEYPMDAISLAINITKLNGEICVPSVPSMRIDPDGLPCQMIRMLPRDRADEIYGVLNSKPNLLGDAIRSRQENVVRALLEYLPILELDDTALTEEDLKAADAPLQRETQKRIRRSIRLGLEMMIGYRRDRAASVRELLADTLPFDVFDLIDRYGDAHPLSPTVISALAE
jgi:hypothetical protein